MSVSQTPAVFHDRSADGEGGEALSISRQGTPELHRAVLRVSLKPILVVATCVFTICPTIALWMVSWQAANKGVSTIKTQGQSAVEDVTVELRSFMMTATKTAFMALVEPTESLILAQAYRLKGSGLLSTPGSTVNQKYSSIIDALGFPYDLLANPYLSVLNYDLIFRPTSRFASGILEDQDRWTVYARMNLDVVQNRKTPTIYRADRTPNQYYNSSVTAYYYLDQTTGQQLFPIAKEPNAAHVVTMDVSRPEFVAWNDDLYFNLNTGMAMVELDYGIPSTDMLASHHLAIYTNVYTVSAFLRSLLSGPKQRLFVFFRSPAGTLIGASHGKYFSHSDVDY
eukprot:RCo001461